MMKPRTRNGRWLHASSSRNYRRVIGMASTAVFIMLYTLLMNTFIAVKNSGYEQQTLPVTLIDRDSQGDLTAPSMLRFDWTTLSPSSPLGKRLHALQNNCSLPYAIHEWRPGQFGIGSDLHIWSNYLWAALIGGFRIKSPGDWLWNDDELCTSSLLPSDKDIVNNRETTHNISSFNCYLPGAEPQCSGLEVHRPGKVKFAECGRFGSSNPIIEVPEFRAAAMEVAFSPVSPLVLIEAERQAQAVFGEAIPPRDQLITIHIRWGDKIHERTKNVAIEKYVNAIEQIVNNTQMPAVHILVCTEDPKALDAFQQAVANLSWTIHVDQFYNEYLPYRKDRKLIFNLPSHIAAETKGKAGLWAMGSLLVALEANHFVLITRSNWSRVINELRKSVVDTRCDGCTGMIDLGYDEC